MKIVLEGCHVERCLDGNVQTLLLRIGAGMSTVRNLRGFLESQNDAGFTRLLYMCKLACLTCTTVPRPWVLLMLIRGNLTQRVYETWLC